MSDQAEWTPVEPTPISAPTAADIQRRLDFEQLTLAALSGIPESAEKWSAGIIAIIGAISAILLFKGSESLDTVTRGFRWPLILLSGGALACAVLALWLLLIVTGRRFKPADRHKTLPEPGANEDLRIRTAAGDSNKIQWAVRLGGAAVAAQVVAILCWWVAPTQPSTPPAYLSVRIGTAAVCGKLISADEQTLRIAVAGYEAQQVVRFADVDNLSVVADCP